MDRTARSASIGPIVRTTLGTVAVVAAFALSWPGIQVARAESAQPDEFESFMAFVGERSSRSQLSGGRDSRGGRDTCAAGLAVQNAEAQAAKTLERMKRRIRQDQAQARAQRNSGDSPPEPEVRMLNARGYNYGGGAQPAAGIGLLHQELAQRRAPRS